MFCPFHSRGSTCSWKSCPISIACPNTSKSAQASASAMQKRVKVVSLNSYDSLPGHTHWTLSGVSPQPSPVRPARSATRTQARAQVTEVTVSGPNFKGTRFWIGMKWRRAPMTRISVALLISQPWTGIDLRHPADPQSNGIAPAEHLAKQRCKQTDVKEYEYTSHGTWGSSGNVQ